MGRQTVGADILGSYGPTAIVLLSHQILDLILDGPTGIMPRVVT